MSGDLGLWRLVASSIFGSWWSSSRSLLHVYMYIHISQPHWHRVHHMGSFPTIFRGEHWNKQKANHQLNICNMYYFPKTRSIITIIYNEKKFFFGPWFNWHDFWGGMIPGWWSHRTSNFEDQLLLLWIHDVAGVCAKKKSNQVVALDDILK